MGDRTQHLSDLRDCVATLLASPAANGQQIWPSPIEPPARAPASSPIPTTAAPDVAVRQAIAPELQEALAAQLAKVLGPIARHLVQRHITAGLTAPELLAALSLEIDDERERQAFVTRGRGVLR